MIKFINTNKYKLLLLITVILLILVVKGYREQKHQLVNYKMLTESTKVDLEFYKDKFNKEHVRSEQILVDSKNKDVAFKELYKRFNTKNINSATSVTSTTSIVIALHDTTYCDNEYVKIVKDSQNIYVEMQDTLTIAEYTTKKWLFGKKKSYIDVYNVNPFVHLNSIKSYKVNSYHPKWLISPSIGLGYSTDTRLRPFIGVTISNYNLSLKIY